MTRNKKIGQTGRYSISKTGMRYRIKNIAGVHLDKIKKLDLGEHQGNQLTTLLSDEQRFDTKCDELFNAKFEKSDDLPTNFDETTLAEKHNINAGNMTASHNFTRVTDAGRSFNKG